MINYATRPNHQYHKQAGFTLVEIMLACVIFPLIVVGLSNGLDAIRKSYTTAKQLNEIYAVLSACPELDRALDYAYVSDANDCSPNDTFVAEGGGTVTYSYSPVLTVTSSENLDISDPWYSLPDSKTVEISVGFINSPTPPLELRMLITRNGIAQL